MLGRLLSRCSISIIDNKYYAMVSSDCRKPEKCNNISKGAQFPCRIAWISSHIYLYDAIGSNQNTTQDHESSNLHNRSSCLLNIQGNTFQASKTNNLSVPPVSPENGTNVVAATIYHPFFNDSARDTALLDYLSATLTTVEGEFPGCGILLCGDFDRFMRSRIKSLY